MKFDRLFVLSRIEKWKRADGVDSSDASEEMHEIYVYETRIKSELRTFDEIQEVSMNLGDE